MKPLKRKEIRWIQNIIKSIAEYEQIDIKPYDCHHVISYVASGTNMKGKNVKYQTVGNFSCWVESNHYEMYEFASSSNHSKSSYGEFLFLAQNQPFHYYLFGTLRVALDERESKRTHQLVEYIEIHNYGKYEIPSGSTKFLKVEHGYDFKPGLPSDTHPYNFDREQQRKSAYHTSEVEIKKLLDIDG